MTPTRWHRIQTLFDAALDATPDERTALLHAAAPDEREEVEALLRADSEASVTFLGEPAAQRAAPLVADLVDEAEAPGDAASRRLGPWRILEEIGRGGMGLVYRGERADGLFEQSVAIKIVRHAGPNLVRRFEHERKALARLNHPNVAHLVDAGRTDDGRPFFVMEYVEGEPITAYAEARELGVADRLLLIEQVCEAVHHAHQHLLVHRDLKPSNVLVTPEGRVKLLDFGIARLLEDAGSEGMPLTRPDFRIMTPEYAAPEQVRGETVTTSADVYALGVLLYELLTGTRPRGAVPARTSARADAIAPLTRPSATHQSDASEARFAARATTPERLRGALRGDLDAIALKALAPTPSRRYSTAEALRADVVRHLGGLPIEARAPTARYRASRFLARHRRASVATAAFVLALALLTALYALNLLEARDAAQASAELARAEAAKAEAVTAYTLGLFGAADPNATQGADVTVRDVLAAGAQRIDGELLGEPEVRARMLRVLGQMHHRLGLLEDADPLLGESARLATAQYGPAHPETAEALIALSALRRDQARLTEADSIARASVAASEQAGGGELLRARALAEYGLTQRARGRYPEAVATLRRAHTSLRGDESPARVTATEQARITLALAQTLDTWSRYDELLDLMPGAYARYHAAHPAPSLEKAQMLQVWGNGYNSTGRLDAARPYYQRALAMTDSLVETSHLARASLLFLLGGLHDDPARQRAAYDEALAIHRAQTGVGTSAAASVLESLGQLNIETGSAALGQAQLDSAYAITERLYGTSIDAGNVAMQQGSIAEEAERWGEAEEAFRRAIAHFDPVVLPQGSANLVRAWSGVGDARAARGQWKAAADAYSRALDAADAVAPLHHEVHREHALAERAKMLARAAQGGE